MRQRERQLNSELQFHLDQLVSDYVRRGMSGAEARRKARQEFAGMEQVKEECRDTRRTRWLDSTLQDIRFAIRTMRKNAALTVTVIGTLALGIGVNTAIFSVVNGVLLSPLPYPRSSRLLAFFETMPQLPRASAADLNYLDGRRLNNTCQDLAALRWSDFNLTGSGDPERLDGRMVSASTCPVLGVAAVAGFFLTRFMSSLLFGVGRTDALTFCGVAIALSLVSVIASLLPALRGSQANPLSALRCE